MNKLKRFLILVVAPLVAVGVAGCDAGGTTTTQATPTLIVEQPAATQARVEEPTQEVGITPRVMEPTQAAESIATRAASLGGPEIPINKSGTLRNLTITVNSMRRWEGDDFYTPDEGNEYVYFNMTVENTGSEGQSFLGSDLYLKDGANKRYSGTIVPMAQPPPSGRIAPGEKKTGEWAFEAAQGATGLILGVDPFGGDRIEIELGQ